MCNESKNEYCRIINCNLNNENETVPDKILRTYEFNIYFSKIDD